MADLNMPAKYMSFGPPGERLGERVREAVAEETSRTLRCYGRDLLRIPPERFLRRKDFGTKSMRRLRDVLDGLSGGEYSQRWYPPKVGKRARRAMISEYLHGAFTND